MECLQVDSFLTTCILVNFVLLAVEHHGMPLWLADILEVCNLILTVIFALELAIRLVAFGYRYFYDFMNCLDAFIVVTSVLELVFLDSGGSVSALRILRLMRILRSMKMIKDGSPLKKLIETAIHSLQAVGNFGVLLGLLLYIYTLLGMSTFGGVLRDAETGEVPRANYDTFIGGFTSVFQVATRENWHVLLYAAMRSPAGAGASVVFYVTLLIVTNYILLALFVGTLLQQFQKHFSEVKKMRSDDQANKMAVLGLVTSAAARLLRRKTAKAAAGSANGSSNQFKTEHGWRAKIAPAAAESPSPPSAAVPEQGKSLCLFRDDGAVRQACVRITKSKLFESMILTAIVISSVLLAIEHPNDDQNTPKAKVLTVLDLIFTAFFATEMGAKIISTGLVFGDAAYVNSWWNVLDGTVVVVSILNFIPGGGEGMKFFRVLRTVRALRPLQAVKRWPGLRMILESIANSIPSIMIVNSLGMFFMLVFGILFVQIFSGALHYCSDPATHEFESCTGTYVAVNTAYSNDGGGVTSTLQTASAVPTIGVQAIVLEQRQWLNNRRNLDHIFAALLAHCYMCHI